MFYSHTAKSHQTHKVMSQSLGRNDLPFVFSEQGSKPFKKTFRHNFWDLFQDNPMGWATGVKRQDWSWRDSFQAGGGDMGLLALVSLLLYKMGISHNKMFKKDISETLLRPKISSGHGLFWVSILLLDKSVPCMMERALERHGAETTS